MGKEKRSFAIIGLGHSAARWRSNWRAMATMSLGIDMDERSVAQMAPLLSATVILDTTDELALREVGIDRDVALVAIGTIFRPAS